MSKREQNKRVNRAAIIGAAQKIFAIQGVETSNVTEIIEKSGLAAGTFYKYFDSKNDLFEEISATIAADIAAIIDNSWKSETDPEDYIKSIVNEVDLYFQADPAALGFILRNYDLLSDSFSDNNAWRTVTSKLVEHMTTAHEMGLLPGHDPELMIKTLVASTSAVLAHIEADCHTISEKRAALMFIKSFLVSSIQKQGPKPKAD